MIKPLNIDLVTITICILCRSAILSPLHPHICTYHNQPLFYNCKNYAMAGPSIAPDPQFLYSSPYQVSSKTPNKIKEPTDGESHPSMQPWGWSSAARDVDLPWCGTVTGDGGGVVLWWVRLTRWECVYMSSSLAAVVFRSIPHARRELPCLYRQADRGLLGTTVRGIQGQRHCSTSGRGESFSRHGSED